MRKFIPVTLFLVSSLLFVCSNAKAQTRPGATSIPAANSAVTSSPAYAEVLLRKTELESDIESLITEYTEDYPKVKETKYQAASLQKELDRLLAVKAADAGKLTLALGKLIVRKCELETDLWSLEAQYKEGHPDV